MKLISPESQIHWDCYHDIRRRILFETIGLYGVYDAQHPDEFSPGNYPKILVHGEAVVGVIRIDLTGRKGILRRVAIDEPHQGRGYARKLIELSEQFVLNHGVKRVISYVARESIGFYEKCGYALLESNLDAGQKSVLMHKKL